MNPVVWGLKPADTIPFLLIGEMVHYIQNCKPSERQWHLHVYSTPKSRQIAMKKMKRGNADIIYVKWDVTMGQILKEGRLEFPMASEKVPRSDKLDIFDQLYRSKRQGHGRQA